MKTKKKLRERERINRLFGFVVLYMLRIIFLVIKQYVKILIMISIVHLVSSIE